MSEISIADKATLDRVESKLNSLLSSRRLFYFGRGCSWQIIKTGTATKNSMK